MTDNKSYGNWSAKDQIKEDQIWPDLCESPIPAPFIMLHQEEMNNKPVFKSIKDRLNFRIYLKSATERYSAMIHAYCPMGNHCHLLLETPPGNFFQNIKNYLYWKYTGKTLYDIGQHFDKGGSGICPGGRQVFKRIIEDNSPAGVINKIEEELSTMKI